MSAEKHLDAALFRQLDISLGQLTHLRSNLHEIVERVTKAEEQIINLQNLLRSTDASQKIVLQPDASLDVLELTSRAWNCLRAGEITTIGQLLATSRKDLLRMPNFGRKSLREVEAQLILHGLRLVR